MLKLCESEVTFMLSIEKASCEDAEIIVKIKTNAYNDETNRFGPGRDGGPGGYNDLNETIRLMNMFDYYKIIYENTIIGGFWLHKVENDCMELEDFCISPKYHNKGFGYKALKQMEKLYKAPSKWILGTPYYSVRNQYLYEKVGFKKVGESEDEFLFFYEKYVE
jgi:GNAT superfamily N-acetyltransferase